MLRVQEACATRARPAQEHRAHPDQGSNPQAARGPFKYRSEMCARWAGRTRPRETFRLNDFEPKFSEALITNVFTIWARLPESNCENNFNHHMKKCTVAILGPCIKDWHLSCWKMPISMLLMSDAAKAHIAHGIKHQRQSLHFRRLATRRRVREIASAGLALVALQIANRSPLDVIRPLTALADNPAHDPPFYGEPCPSTLNSLHVS